ncbi:mannosyl-oligosaccharide 1,2-alpha-mannosidase IA-like [Oppia nitens]|uniref:mannosyl-oligosaccharide 1,2-alpha-mannosidase IA-like n=1 Tax=Oppia nitens TaxID=1686743 RepID=UPI0023DB917E|nr:mannosyl-oligosaccharide 1,2-alpha-mannosidase IA-like [Oppia nitens]
MSGRNVLPTHYSRSSTQFPILSPNGRSILRIREKYLLVLVVIVFIVFSVIGVAFLPELKASNVYKYIKPADNLGPDLLGLVPPIESGHALGGHDTHTARAKFEDAERLRAKISQHFSYNLSQLNAVLPKPNENALPQDLTEKHEDFDDNWKPLVLPNGEDSDPEVRKKRDFIKEMMREAWVHYKTYAWGENELKPISKKGHSAGIFGTTKLGATIVDGLDTLFIMGMKDEFKEGRDWIQQNLNFDEINSEVSVFETVIRFVGGLLTCYAFTKDDMFLEKANSIAARMLPAFNTPTGLPHALVNPSTGSSKNYVWASQSSSILSEVGTLHLEFLYLSDITGDNTYKDKVISIRHRLNELPKPHGGLYPNYISPKTGQFGQPHISVGALGDSFYEYLLKEWIQSGGKDMEARHMWDEAIAAIDKNLVQKSRSGLTYIAEMKYDRLEHKMDHLACFITGLIALSGQSLDAQLKNHYLELGAQLSHTCHESYARTDTGIGPESFRFTDNIEAKAVRPNEKYYIQRPEVIEGWFYMWRLTHDNKYRDWAWEATQAIYKYCRTETGYSGIKNVYDVNGPKDDVQQSFLLAETLKYLYLIFSTDDLVSFEEWVFNTEAHPLPIFGKNPAYYKKSLN